MKKRIRVPEFYEIESLNKNIKFDSFRKMYPDQKALDPPLLQPM